MVTRAVLKYIRLTPRKFRQIIPLVKGKHPEDAIQILMSTKKKASVYGIEILKSAIANAKRVQGVDEDRLFISKLIADCGPQLKRFRAGSMGRASPILKRTCHITVELDQTKDDAVQKEQPAPKKTAAHAAKEKAHAPHTREKIKEASKKGKQVKE